MQILPTSLQLIGTGLRPRLACEVRPSGIVAARSDDAAGVLAAVSSSELSAGALVPGLRSGNIADRSNFIRGLQRALDPLSSRTKDLTLIVPDSAARVLLLEFDSLPSRPLEALAVVRFRLKKLLSFEADTAAVSYQVMSSGKNLIRVVAAAMPREVLDEYELAVRDAGYEPGAVLPSTLASLTLLPARNASDPEQASLIVNANQYSVTTAIVRSGILLLHRTLDFTIEVPALAEVRAEENAAEMPVPVFATNLDPAPPVVTQYVEPLPEWEIGTAYPGDDSRIEAAAAMQADQLRHEIENEALAAAEADESGITRDVAQAVSVAAAYFEDTLNTPPTQILSSGSIDAKALQAILAKAGFGDALVHVREIVPAGLLHTDAASASAPRSLLAGVAGALATGDAQS